MSDTKDPRANPGCSKARCRACLGYGVLTLGGGPSHRACLGESREGLIAAAEMLNAHLALKRTAWWRRRERRRLKRVKADRLRRVGEIRPSWLNEQNEAMAGAVSHG